MTINYDFDSDYALMLTAWGEGEVSEEDSICTIEKIYEEYGGIPEDISLFIDDPFSSGFNYGYTSISTSYLEKLENLKELILPDSITEIKMSPKLEKILKTNNCLIRGSFDSFAERFALENDLHFRPSDFVFARHVYEAYNESTVMTIEFNRDGNVKIKESISSPGSSAGNCFGGVKYYDLEKDFYKTETVESIAKKFRNSIYNAIIKDGRLAKFLEKAKSHKMYMEKN